MDKRESLMIKLDEKKVQLQKIRDHNMIAAELRLIKGQIKDVKKKIKDERPSISNKIKNRWRMFIDGF